MAQRFSLLFSSTVLAATLSLPALAQEYSDGGKGARGRKEATLTPVEAFGVHPPGPDPGYAHRCIFHRWKYAYIPYYAPLAPVATSVRWKPWCYFPLLPYYTPYYMGYCPKRLCQPKPAPYGSDGWGQGPMPDHPLPHDAGPTPLRYGVYTSVLQDDTVFWNMGGNGLVPYGTPRPAHEGPPDLVDMIQASRKQGVILPPPPPVVGAPAAVPAAVEPPAETLPSPTPDENKGPAPKANDARRP